MMMICEKAIHDYITGDKSMLFLIKIKEITDFFYFFQRDTCFGMIIIGLISGSKLAGFI
jgi:hypothetical protein